MIISDNYKIKKVNKDGKEPFPFPIEDPDDLKKLEKFGNRSISDLIEENKDLLIFPDKSNFYGNIGRESIFELHGNILTTGNIMGFVGIDGTMLTIKSRFDEGENNYFLHYMLQKVMSLNIFDFKQKSGKEDSFYDLLLCLFPYYLEKALKQGLYREYHRNEYNDANVRGAIDVKLHIKLNVPFVGKVAYTMREYVHDNPIMQLVRHTIEYIKVHPIGKHILSKNPDRIEDVNKIIFHTQNYNRNNRQKIINFNIKKTVNHPYFSEYKTLQKICLRILQKDKLNFGGQSDKIYGLLFDGAWLWEEYVNTLIEKYFWHPRNKKRSDGQRLFYGLDKNKEEGLIYPDFVSRESSPRIIADAKYRPIENIKGPDYLQLLAYMYRFNSKTGYYIYPRKPEETEKEKTLSLLEGDDFGENSPRKREKEKIIITKLGMKIPQSAGNFDNFSKEIKAKETEFLKNLAKFS
jgi:5-methylcytosine-specific restriction endonuclease McrBC regulatory subunit McrC